MPKEVIFIAGRDPLTFVSGDTNYIRAHARAALRIGFTPHIFCAAPRAGVVETDFGVVHRVASPFRPFRFLMMPAHEPFIATAIRRFLQACQPPHLLHGFGVWAHSGLVVSQQLARQGRVVVPIASVYTTMRHETGSKLRALGDDYGRLWRGKHWLEDAWTRLVIQYYERRLYLQSRLVVVNYEAMRRQILAEFGSGPLIRRLPYSAEAAFLPQSLAAELPSALARLAPVDAPLIVSVSRHDPRKGLDVLLRALAELQAAGVGFRACLVGGGLLLEAHRRLASRLALTDSTVIVGRVSDAAVYLQHADIFVLSSLQEGSGSLSLLEALQAETAIVASNVDGIPEDVTNGDSALLVEPGNVTALSRALRRVVTDSALRKYLRRRARATFEAQFSAAALTNALRDLYAELGFEGNTTI